VPEAQNPLFAHVMALNDYVSCPWDRSLQWASPVHARESLFPDLCFKTPGERGRWLIAVEPANERIVEWAIAAGLDEDIAERICVPVTSPAIREPDEAVVRKLMEGRRS